MARWLHTLQQFQFSIVHWAGRDHSNADGLSRVPTSPCGQCTRVDFPRVDTAVEVVDQPFDAESVGDWEDADLVPIQSGEDWVAQLDDELSRPATRTGEAFRICALQLEDTTFVMLLEWIRADAFPPWKEVKGLCPEVRFLWHHRNNLSADANGVIWRKRSSQGSQLQLLVPRLARESLFLAYHASLFGGHLGRNRYERPPQSEWPVRTGRHPAEPPNPLQTVCSLVPALTPLLHIANVALRVADELRN